MVGENGAVMAGIVLPAHVFPVILSVSGLLQELLVNIVLVYATQAEERSLLRRLV